MLDYLRIKEVRLITNNPLKVNSLKNLGINVVDRVSITVGLNIFNKGYLQTKQERMSHMYENIDFK
jgi:GTP cyclohydrolase II